MARPSKIGILGSGDVGQALGKGFAAHGWDVMLGSRSPDADKLAAWKADVEAGSETETEAEGTVSTGTFAEAAAHGDVVILALNGAHTEDALELAGPDTFAGKLVLDATNPLAFPDDGYPTLFVGTTDSLGERVQRKLPDAKVVKCFNTISNSQMVDPSFEGPAPEPRMYICGNDEDAKKRTDDILRGIGWAGALDVGDIAGARWLEAMVPLWVRVGGELDTWGHFLTPVR